MKYLVVAVLCLSLCGCKEKIYKEMPKEVTVSINNKIEVYNNTYLYDLIAFENAEMITKNELIIANTLGTKEIEVFYRYNKKKYLYVLNITVEDTTPPEILGSGNRTIQVGHTGKICNLIMYGDNYERRPNCTVEGEYDVNKVGYYNLNYIITDGSNNQTEHKMTLHVIKPSNNTSSGTTKRLQFSEVLDRYKNDKTEIGIDVSKWQGDIDFNKVKDAGATFVMMRIGVQKAVNGELEIDPYYLQNMERARKAGLKVGVYLYSISTSVEESVEHANWVIKTLNGTKLDLPIVFDWESWSWWNDLGLSFYDINSIADTFIETVNKSGYEGMLYSSKYYLEYIWQNKNEHPVWLAHYTSETNYVGNYIMWQLSSVGRIPGIKGDVDINILYHE